MKNQCDGGLDLQCALLSPRGCVFFAETTFSQCFFLRKRLSVNWQQPRECQQMLYRVRLEKLTYLLIISLRLPMKFKFFTFLYYFLSAKMCDLLQTNIQSWT